MKFNKYSIGAILGLAALGLWFVFETSSISSGPDLERGIDVNADPPASLIETLSPIRFPRQDSNIASDAKPPQVGKPRFGFSGQVVDRDGGPIKNAHVVLRSKLLRSVGASTWESFSDNDGRFEFLELPWDVIALRTSADGFVTMVELLDCQAVALNSSPHLVVMREGATLDVHLTDQFGGPVSNAQVSLISSPRMRLDGGEPRQTNSDKSGIARFSHVSPGIQALEVRHSDGVFSRDSCDIPSSGLLTHSINPDYSQRKGRA